MTDYRAREEYRKPEEAASYDARRFATWKGRLGHALDQWALGRALRAVESGVSAPLRILDIPCGTGRFRPTLLDRGYRVTGADVSLEMIQVSRAKHDPTPLMAYAQLDASKLAFCSDAFDCVMSVRFLGHIPADVRVQILREFARVSPAAILEVSLQSVVASLVGRLRFGTLGSGLPKRWSWHVFSGPKLAEELASAGLRISAAWPKLRWLSNSWYVLATRGD